MSSYTGIYHLCISLHSPRNRWHKQVFEWKLHISSKNIFIITPIRNWFLSNSYFKRKKLSISFWSLRYTQMFDIESKTKGENRGFFESKNHYTKDKEFEKKYWTKFKTWSLILFKKNNVKTNIVKEFSFDVCYTI